MIRRAKICDLEAMVQINVNAWKKNYKGIIDDDFLETRTKEYVYNKWKELNWIEDNETITFVCEDNNLIKGFVSGKKNEKYDCEIVSIYVDPEYQNLNIGRKLFEQGKKHFKNIGCKNMIIWTIKGLPNNGFYKKMGGIVKEENEIEYGNKKYLGIGFVFEL